MDDKYRQLARNLDDNPVGAPLSKEFIQMLEILYPANELELALLLSFRTKKLEDIAKEAGIPEEEASRILEGMADKGTIFSKQAGDSRSYRLLPIYAGIFEYTTLSDKFDGATHKKLNELWHHWYMKSLVHELAEAQPAWKRVYPTETAIMKPDQVLPYELASEMIKTKAKSIALGNCTCRLIEQNCDKPVETCLGFDDAADYMIERGMARRIDADEALKVLKLSEDAGLVHLGSNNKNNLLFICNCCSDCCHVLRQYTEFNYPQGISKSNFLAVIEEELCNGCAICAEERCPVGAIKMADDIAVVEDERCIGCGLCANHCPTDAILLVKKDALAEVPETLGELTKTVWENKKINRANPDFIR